MLDAIDIKILDLLQTDARTPNTEIAHVVGLVPSAVLERIRRLEKKGVIEGYTARVNPKALGLGLTAYVSIRAQERPGTAEMARQLAKLPEVLEMHYITGQDCLLAKVRAADTDDLGELLRVKFSKIRAIKSTRTTIVLETVKETSVLPLKEPD